MPKSNRWNRAFVTALLVAALTAGCDLSPTALESLDDAEVRQLVIRATPAGPVRSLWLNLLRNADTRAANASALPGLDSLFSMALSTQKRIDAQAQRAQHLRLTREAWLAIERDDFDAGQNGLEAARAYQADAVVRSMGTVTPVVLIAVVSRRLDQIQKSGVLDSDAENERLRAMSLTVRDLIADAKEALARSQHALALDLASHAGGLLNSIQTQLQKP